MTGKYLSGLYNNRNSIKMKLIQDAENKGIILKIFKIKKVLKGLRVAIKLK